MARKRGTVVSRTTMDGVRHRARIRINYHDTYGPWRITKKAATSDLEAMRHAEESTPLATATMLQAWHAHIERLQARGTRETSLHGYKLKWQALTRFFEPSAQIALLDPGDVEAYVRFRRPQVKVRTILHETALLRAICNTAIKRGWLVTNPVVRAELPRAEEGAEPDWFTRAELAAILITVRSAESGRDTERDADTMEFLAMTGLRLSEAAALERRDINLPKMQVVVRKGKRGARIARITKALKPIVKRLLNGTTEPTDNVLGTPEQLKWMCRYWARLMGEPRLHCHALRHTFATAVAKASGSPFVVMAALGHSNITMSMRYCHLAGVDVEHLDQVRFDGLHAEPTERAAAPDS